jgi:hypothetical protein
LFVSSTSKLTPCPLSPKNLENSSAFWLFRKVFRKEGVLLRLIGLFALNKLLSKKSQRSKRNPLPSLRKIAPRNQASVSSKAIFRREGLGVSFFLCHANGYISKRP